jgi:hypothetical protein
MTGSPISLQIRIVGVTTTSAGRHHLRRRDHRDPGLHHRLRPHGLHRRLGLRHHHLRRHIHRARLRRRAGRRLLRRHPHEGGELR